MNTIGEPPLNAPEVTVTVSTPPATAAEAAGEPVPADVKVTVFADKLCGALPPRVMSKVLPVGMVASGVNETVIETELALLATLLSEIVGALAPSDPFTIATMEPSVLDSIKLLPLVNNADCTVLYAIFGFDGLVTVLGSTRVNVLPPSVGELTENEMVRTEREGLDNPAMFAVAVREPDTVVT